ncbi:MAG: glycosyltransferase family 39 protein [Paludibacteraceae bacterium]|nr:glycosyltransferase family 39 protein [Paludibacteraceae bacterium]
MKGETRIWPWLLVWGILDLLCALFCEIHADEAYYRLYGQFLSWGYFDHPPMVGLMTAISGALIPTTSLILKNLSVRLVTVLMHVATVWVVWKTVRIYHLPFTIYHFLLIAASLPMFCAYGFLTTPDAPLLFFAALFYYAYRRYLTDHSWSMTTLLGISMAGMLYSKYMAVLVIGLTVVANWRLLKDKRAWMAVGIAAVLMVPHLWWQYSHNFPSFTYHLVSRAEAYRPLFTWEYIPNQWAVFNPLVWALMVWLSIKAFRTEDLFRHTLAWTVLGFQVFFLLMSFRGHVEPHWTVVTSLPAIILLTEEEALWRRGVSITFGVFAGLIVIARIVLMLNILPPQSGLAGKQAQCEAIHAEAQGLPVVFDGSFQQPSLYRFFYDDQAVLVRNQYNRYTQYDLLHLERDLIGQPACVRRFGQVYITDCLTEQDLHE